MKIKSHRMLWLVVPVMIISFACGISDIGAKKILPTVDNVAIETNAAETLAVIARSTATEPVIVEPPSPTAPPEPSATHTAPPLPDATATSQPIILYPDVLHVAYIKDGNVYLWREGDASLGLTSTHDAADVRISDDGSLIAYIRQESFLSSQEIWVINTTGPLESRVLVSREEMDALKDAGPHPDALGLRVTQFEWRPGTHDLAYHTAPIYDGPGFSPNEDLRLVNADTLEKTTLLDFDQGGMFYYSPDGSQIGLSRPEFISLINADGSNLRDSVLTFPSVLTYSEYQYHPHLIWAEDSQSLRVAIPPADPMIVPLPPTNLWKIPVDGSSPSLVNSITAIPFFWPNNAFTPDLLQVMYLKPVGEPQDNILELHIAIAEGTADFVFTTGVNVRTMSWSPDSYRFLYYVNDGTNSGVFLGEVTSGGSTIITSEPALMQDVRWIEPSRFIYFWKNSGASELRISDVDGSRHAFIDTVSDTLPAYDFTP